MLKMKISSRMLGRSDKPANREALQDWGRLARKEGKAKAGVMGVNLGGGEKAILGTRGSELIPNLGGED